MARPKKRTRTTAKKNNPGKLTIREISYSKEGKTYTSWQVQGWKENGKWQRKQFKERKKAERFVAKKSVELLNAVQLHDVTTKLRPGEVEEAENAFRRLNGRYSLDEAVEFFLAHYAEPEEPKSFKEAERQFIYGKEAEGVRPRSLKQLESTLGMFRKFMERKGFSHIHEPSTQDIEKFLRSIRAKNGVDAASRKTWNNYRGDLHAFYAWCGEPRRRWVGVNPVSSIPKFKVSGGIPETLTIKQTLKLMRDVEQFKDGRLVRYFALALFSGLRTGPEGELSKLSAHPDSDRLIDLKRGIIHVPPEVSKTNQKRQIVIRQNLHLWLQRFPGPIFPTNYDRDIKTLRKQHGLTHDVLRHTFFSYHIAAFRSISDAALEGGNTEGVTKSHYLNLATRTEGEAFWRVAPKGVRIQPRVTAVSIEAA